MTEDQNVRTNVKSFYKSNNEERFQKRGSMDDLGDAYLPLINTFLSLAPEGRILDAGCGVGRDARYMNNVGRDVVSLDISREQLQFVNLNPTQADLSQLPLKSDTFSAVWAPSSVFFIPEHDIPEAIREIYRVTDKDGVCSIGFKIGDRTERVTMNRYGSEVPFQLFTESDAIDIVLEQGFEIEETTVSDVGERTFMNLMLNL